MAFGLGKLFGNKEAPEKEPSEVRSEVAKAPETPPSDGTASVFLRRDAVFNRQRRLIGYVFRLQQRADAGADTPTLERRHALDDALLKSLCASARDEGWGEAQAFVPLSTAAAGSPRLEALPAKHTVLLFTLAPGSTDPTSLSRRLLDLKARGFTIGVFRQPSHPIFPVALAAADFAAIDVAASQGNNVRDFSIALHSDDVKHPVSLLAVNIESRDDYALCHHCRYHYFHGPFILSSQMPGEKSQGSPHKLNLLHLINLIHSDAETPKVVAALKQDPMLTYRIMRYLNSAAIGLAQPVTSVDHALILLGRQRLARWLSVLLFSVKDPDFADWLLVERSLGRGRMMELLGRQRMSAAEADQLFLTGVFSCLDRLLGKPLPEALAEMPLTPNISAALLERSGPYAPMLALAEACEAFDPPRIEAAAQEAGFDPDAVNRALLEVTVWTSEITKSWE